MALQESNQSAKALEVLEEIQPGDEFYVDAVLHRAEILEDTGKHQDALSLLQDNAAKFTKEPDFVVGLASLKEAAGLYAEAEELLRRGR